TAGAVANQLDSPEDPQPADFTDTWMAFGQVGQRRPDDIFTQPSSVADNAFFAKYADRRGRGGTSQHMAGISQPTRIRALIKTARDALRDDDPAQRHIARGGALGEGDEIRCDVPVINSEPFAAAAEPCHHLVGNEDDAVFVAQSAHAGQITRRWHQNTVGS